MIADAGVGVAARVTETTTDARIVSGSALLERGCDKRISLLVEAGAASLDTTYGTRSPRDKPSMKAT
jgi:hypothetical protein